MFSSRLIEFWCFGLPVTLGRGQVGGDVWRHLWACGVSLHTCTHMCMHTHMYTYTEIANGCQHGGTHVYHVYHACGCVCTCMHVHVCAWCTPPHTPKPIHPPANPQGGTPKISQNSITLELIKIIQFCLKI